MSPNEFNEIKSLLVEINNKVSALTDTAQKELLTPAEVCAMLKIGRSTYQRYVENAVFKQVRLDNGRRSKVYIQRADVLRLIDEGRL